MIHKFKLVQLSNVLYIIATQTSESTKGRVCVLCVLACSLALGTCRTYVLGVHDEMTCLACFKKWCT